MIRAAALSRDGVPILILGLPSEDLRDLLIGRPQTLDATSLLGTAVRVLILGGPSAEAIIRDMNAAGMTIDADGTVSAYWGLGADRPTHVFRAARRCDGPTFAAVDDGVITPDYPEDLSPSTDGESSVGARGEGEARTEGA